LIVAKFAAAFPFADATIVLPESNIKDPM
jgi:hypothetical protein